MVAYFQLHCQVPSQSRRSSKFATSIIASPSSATHRKDMSTTHHLGHQKHQMLHILVKSLFPSLSQGRRWCICRYSLVINILLVYMQPSSIGFGCEAYNEGVASHAWWKRDPVELIAAVSDIEFQCVPWYYWCLFSESLLLSERN